VSLRAGVPRLALATEGLADPPTHATPMVRFNASKGTATVVTVVTDDDEGKHWKKTVLRYRLVDGMYVAIKKR